MLTIKLFLYGQKEILHAYEGERPQLHDVIAVRKDGITSLYYVLMISPEVDETDSIDRAWGGDMELKQTGYTVVVEPYTRPQGSGILSVQ